MIIGLIGRMGTGKTLSAVRYAYNYYKQGYSIYSNIKLNFPHTFIGLQDLVDYANANINFEKSVILVDEMHVLLDSRSSGSKRNKILTHLIVLTRHLGKRGGCHVLYTSQFIHQVDKRLRSNTDILIKCQSRKLRGEQYTLNLVMIMQEFGIKTKRDIFKSRFYYDKYDTHELIKVE